MIWFTSDTHFGHENVLKFTDRPWETIWQMNDAIVDNINGRVAVDDELYILGDFSFKMTAQDAYALRKRIALPLPVLPQTKPIGDARSLRLQKIRLEECLF